MEARDPELKKELDATLQARNELGADYEPALIESFLEKVEQRMDGMTDRHVRRRLAEQQMVAARGGGPRSPSPASGFGERFGFGVVSLVLAIPLTAIAAVNTGFKGLVVCWLGIVAVNAVHAARGWPWADRNRREASDWEE
ncbi:hypothetical protein ACIRQP_29840 [Streptomyces sp. NPDC102274]|uniref:hypothetical protein n=1 Tax=Streptomyces sp. NPDC102274 TaxID=3366151 RepID=UPI0038112932